MERAVDVVQDRAPIWLRSMPSEATKDQHKESFKTRGPTRKPEALWSKTKEPEIVLETEAFQKKKQKKKLVEDDELDFTKAREKLRQKFEYVLTIPAEIKEKLQSICLRDTASRVEVSEAEESRSGKEIDFDREYDIIELHEHILVIGGASGGQGNEPTDKVEAYDIMSGEWRQIEPLPLETTACYATAIIGKVSYTTITTIYTLSLFDKHHNKFVTTSVW